MKNVISDNKIDRIYYSSYLAATAILLKKKHYMSEPIKETTDFLLEYHNKDYQADEEFIKKYRLDVTDEEEQAERPEQITVSEAIKLNKEKEKSKEEKTPRGEGKIFRCQDGDYVRSKAEREIDNFFFNNRIWHIYEYKYEHPVTEEWAIPDFYLPDHNLFIEYFGLDTPEYIEKREHKIKMYRSDKSIRFEYLTYEDDADINGKLIEICKKYNIPLK